MIYQIVLVSIAVSASVLAAPQPPPPPPHGPPPPPHGPHEPHYGPHHPPPPPPPPFLENVTAEGRDALHDIVHNENLTATELESQVEAWAKTNGVAEEYKAYETNQTSELAEVQKNVTNILANLTSVQSQLEAIYSNKTLTGLARDEAIDAIKKEHPQVVESLFFIARAAGGHGGPKGVSGPWGPPPLGGPKPPKGHKGPKEHKRPGPGASKESAESEEKV